MCLCLWTIQLHPEDNVLKEERKKKKGDIYLSASVSVSLLDPVVVSWLERDGRAEEELRLAPPGPPSAAADDDDAAAIPVWLLVPVDEEVEAFL